MYCRNCGANLPEGAQNCPACGTAVMQESQAPLQAPAEMPLAENVAPVEVPASAESAAPLESQPVEGYIPPPVYQVPPAQPGYDAPQPQWSGAPASEGQIPPQGPYPGQPMYAQMPPPQKKKGKIALILSLSLVAFLAVAGVLWFFLFAALDPKSSVQSAIAKTGTTLGAEQLSALEKSGLSTYKSLEDKPLKFEMILGLEPDDLMGEVTIEMTGNSDFTQRRIDMDWGVGMSGTSILEGNVAVDDSLVAVSIPELYEGSLGFSTVNFSDDLFNSDFADLLYLSEEDLATDISFNLFDELEKQREASKKSADGWAALKNAEELVKLYEALWEDATVAKPASEEIRINTLSLETKMYTVVFPEDNVIDFVEGLSDFAGTENDALNEIRSLLSAYSLSSYSGYNEDQLEYMVEDFVDSLDGDVECNFYIAGGVVRKLEMMVPLQEEVKIVLELGDEKYLSNVINFEVQNNEETVVLLESKGDHVFSGGTFTTSTTLEIYDYYEEDLIPFMELDMEFAPEKKTDNLSMEMYLYDSLDEYFINVDGSIETGKDYFKMDLYDITVDDTYSAIQMSLVYNLSPGDPRAFKPVDPQMLFEMKTTDLMELGEEISENLENLQDRLDGLI